MYYNIQGGEGVGGGEDSRFNGEPQGYCCRMPAECELETLDHLRRLLNRGASVPPPVVTTSLPLLPARAMPVAETLNLEMRLARPHCIFRSSI